MDIPLGKHVQYADTLDPSVLFPIARADARAALGIPEPEPFEGRDYWRAFEISWLNLNNFPQVAVATISYPANSRNLVESKSLKLFLNSLNNDRFSSEMEVSEIISTALRGILKCDDVAVEMHNSSAWEREAFCTPPGECIDSDPPEDPGAATQLSRSSEVVSEVVYTNLLRSLCPVTGQPDWGTLVVAYTGKKLDRHALLAEVVQHRNYQGFHEECCEKFFMKLITALEPTALTVGCFYTRRGGIDINPIRWLLGTLPAFQYQRHFRQ